MNLDFFNTPPEPWTEPLSLGALVLRQYATAHTDSLLAGIHAIAAQAPFRQMQTLGGYTMSVAMTNCGTAGWITDRKGYRYSTTDPLSGQAWPALPADFRNMAQAAALAAGFPAFQPDACLINRYPVGAKMALHQDRDERDLTAPIVSVS